MLIEISDTENKDKFYVMCDGKRRTADSKRKAYNLAKNMASKSPSHRSGVYENDRLIRTITIYDLC